MRKVTLTLSAIALALSLNGAAMAKVHMPEVVSPGVTVTE
ncbi:TPA: acid phosphatase AphA, partial [Proteus mirabilis]|nr:acid phosphatase AphA [Proteus mirabilis]